MAKNGSILLAIDTRGKTTHYSYDSLGRISQITYDDQTVTYTWDNCTNGINRLCSLSNNTGTTRYSYDSHGRITQKNQTPSTAATPLTVSHTYNSAGQHINSLSPGGQTLEYQWTGNRITAVYSNGQPVINQISYEPDGQVNGWTWGNNQQNERFYDLAGRTVIVSMGFDAQTQLQSSRYYGYDAAGRQTSAIDDIDPSLNRHHDYDQLDRLTSSQRGEAQISRTDYSYDLSGNRSEKIKDSATPHSYSTDPNSNRLLNQSGAQTVSYSYDPAGNLTDDGTYNHTYNAAGRRITTTNTTTAQTTHYGYDALGQRITKTNAGNTSQYFYDEQGHLTGEYDGSGQLIQEIIWLGDLPIAVLKPTTLANATTATTDLYYIHADHLGTPRKITRPNDNRVVWSWESEAFGNSLPDQNPSGLGNFVFNLRFPGQYYDQETGLFYNYFRDYDPTTGRYIESDPIGLAGGINTYGYVGENPIRFSDPLGLDVYLCKQPAFGWAPIDHHWIKTDTKEAGMGGTRGNGHDAGNQSGDLPGDPVQVTDHSGRANEPGASCEVVSNVDENKVNDLLKIGKPLGNWTPNNQCQSFARDVLNSSRYSPGASGSWTRGATGGW